MTVERPLRAKRKPGQAIRPGPNGAYTRTEKDLPLWVRALAVYVETRWPVGAYGYSVSREVLTEIKRHYRQEAALQQARRSAGPQ